MEIRSFESVDIDLVCSFLRVGADVETALAACATHDGKPWPREMREEFKRQHGAEIETAQAQCRVLCLHNIMTEGTANSARWILERAEGGTPKTQTPASPFAGLLGD